MKVLVDTCVLSEIRRPQGNPAVRAALSGFPEDDLFISVVTVGEIVKGIELLPPGRKKQELTQWVTGLCNQFDDRVLPIDLETARVWGEITARSQVQGLPLPVSDGLIAATALRRGIHVMTRNTQHFASSGALITDPWAIG